IAIVTRQRPGQTRVPTNTRSRPGQEEAEPVEIPPSYSRHSNTPLVSGDATTTSPSAFEPPVESAEAAVLGSGKLSLLERMTRTQRMIDELNGLMARGPA